MEQLIPINNASIESDIRDKLNKNFSTLQNEIENGGSNNVLRIDLKEFKEQTDRTETLNKITDAWNDGKRIIFSFLYEQENTNIDMVVTSCFHYVASWDNNDHYVYLSVEYTKYRTTYKAEIDVNKSSIFCFKYREQLIKINNSSISGIDTHMQKPEGFLPNDIITFEDQIRGLAGDCIVRVRINCDGKQPIILLTKNNFACSDDETNYYLQGELETTNKTYNVKIGSNNNNLYYNLSEQVEGV